MGKFMYNNKKSEQNLKDIGRRLKLARESLGLKQIEVDPDTSHPMISAAETGKKRPPSKYLFTLFFNYGVSLDWILSGKGEMFENRQELDITKALQVLLPDVEITNGVLELINLLNVEVFLHEMLIQKIWAKKKYEKEIESYRDAKNKNADTNTG